ncbi:MAG: cellulase family glycosylhydrolase [Pseudomonadota bacterium]
MNIEGLTFGDPLPGQVGVDYFRESESTLNYYFKYGINYFRIPFRWERIQPILFGPLDMTYVSYIMELVEPILAKGGRCILDMHNYAVYYLNGIGYQIGTRAVPFEAYFDAWLKISEIFGNVEGVDYCLMNEPITNTGSPTLQADFWANGMQEMVNRLRDAHYGNLLQVSGVSFSSAFTFINRGNAKAYENFKDPAQNSILEVHAYDNVNTSGGGDLTVTNAREGIYNLYHFTQWARENNFKVLLGETGIDQDGEMSQQSTFRKLDFMHANRDVWFGVTFWGGGGKWPGSYGYGLLPKSGKPNYPDIPPNMQRIVSFMNRDQVPRLLRYHFDFEEKDYFGHNNPADFFVHSRNSQALSRTKNGLFTLFAANQLRITDAGLDIEKQTTELLDPVHFDLSPGVALENITLSKGFDAPDGTKNAFRITDNATDDNHDLIFNYDFELDERYIFSVFAKQIDFPMVSAFITSPGVIDIRRFENPLFSPDSAMFGTGFDYLRLNPKMPVASNQFFENLGVGFALDDSLGQDFRNDPYVGIGSQIQLWHPSLTQDEYVTSPVPSYGQGAGSVRAADDIAFPPNIITMMEGDFTMFFEICDLPMEAVDIPILNIDGTDVLYRASDGRIETIADIIGAALQTELPERGVTESLLGLRIGISVNRTTPEVRLKVEGLPAIATTSGTFVSTLTTAKFGIGKMTVKKWGFVDTALSAEQLDQLVEDH